MSEQLWNWWDERLTEELRAQLIALGNCDPSGDLALALWRTSGPLRVVEPETWSIDADPNRWRLTPEVRDFLVLRQYEHYHPEPQQASKPTIQGQEPSPRAVGTGPDAEQAPARTWE